MDPFAEYNTVQTSSTSKTSVPRVASWSMSHGAATSNIHEESISDDSSDDSSDCSSDCSSDSFTSTDSGNDATALEKFHVFMALMKAHSEGSRAESPQTLRAQLTKQGSIASGIVNTKDIHFILDSIMDDKLIRRKSKKDPQQSVCVSEEDAQKACTAYQTEAQKSHSTDPRLQMRSTPGKHTTPHAMPYASPALAMAFASYSRGEAGPAPMAPSMAPTAFATAAASPTAPTAPTLAFTFPQAADPSKPSTFGCCASCKNFVNREIPKLVTSCGHLYCGPCYANLLGTSSKCLVCKAPPAAVKKSFMLHI